MVGWVFVKANFPTLSFFKKFIYTLIVVNRDSQFSVSDSKQSIMVWELLEIGNTLPSASVLSATPRLSNQIEGILGTEIVKDIF